MTTFDVVTVTLNPALDWTLQIPDFAAGTVNRVAAEGTRAGGKGINVAASLAPRFGVAATGFLGVENEAAFTSFCADASIADAFVRVSGATRVGIKIVSAEGTTDINFAGAAVSGKDLAALRARITVLAASRPYFVLAGSVPPGVEPSIYRELTAELKAAGCRVALDTSGDALRLALDAAPDVIKPNIHELEVLTGSKLMGPNALLEAARSLMACGIELVAISMGADGAMFVTPQRSASARPPSIPVNSTVGAGDAMVAGIVAAQLAGESLEDLARTATAYSLRALGAEGDVESLRGRVVVG